MKPTLILFFVLALFSTDLFAQKNGTVKGVAYDTLAKKSVSAVTITVLDKKDSSLVSFTMTDNNGNFELRGIPNGSYRLMLSHVSYYNTSKYFSISDSSKQVNLGNIALSDRSRVLEEVVVEAEAPPITMIEDTVQYNAGSFRTQPNANVEQLLKKLPGVKVDKDGAITAQGEKVNRVLVDGKEFFGNDPKIATRNLPADAIDKVQVYDKQSDQAQLTGFEDGNYEKTINLKLKKDKKKGVFGKLTAGAGNKDLYEMKGNVNSFKGARQMSAIGMANNNNAEGFSFMDILNFTGELSRMQRGSSGGNININISGDDAAAMGVNGGGRNGITTSSGGGINYNNIIGSKNDFQSNYFYNRYNPQVQRTTNRLNLLPNGNTNYLANSFSNNINSGHRLNLNNLYQVDSFNSIRIIPSLSFQETNNRSRSDYKTLREDGSLVNEGNSNTVSNNKGFNFRNEIAFRKKFRRKGRTFSLTLQTSLNESDGDGTQNSVNAFYNPSGSLLRRDTINQQSETEASLKSYNLRAVYTEPLFKRSLMEFSAAKSNSKNISDKTTWDYNKNSGQFDKMNPQQTNNFENTYGYTNAGFRIRKQGRKYNYAVGINWQQADLEGNITSGVKDSLITKSFRNWLPNARFQYNFTRFKNISFNYNATTNQPSVSQLQPIPDISNQLYIREGNPDLKQELTHTVQGNLFLMSPYKNKNFMMFFNYRRTQNKIVNYDVVDNVGIRTTKPVNVDGIYSMTGDMNFSMPVRFLKGMFEIGNRVSFSNDKQFINTQENTIKTLTFGPEVSLSASVKEKLDLSFEASFNINNSKYSLNAANNVNYLQQRYGVDADWQLPKRFFFSTDFGYTINSQRADGFNGKIPIWNASISKQFMKYSRGEIKLSAFDLLNENTGINRTSNQNYIEDSRVNTLQRFFMLTFTYSLTKSGLSNGDAHGGARVMMR
jgi:hypothetical protein